VLASGTLVAIFPLWAPSRTMYGSIGLGVALAGALSAAGPALLAALVAVKLVAFAVSPGAPRVVAGLPQESGAFTDFGKIARLQLLMRETRGMLHRRFPRLPHGAMIGQNNMPIAAQYAFGGSKSLQVWYRDTTLRWVRSSEFKSHLELDLSAMIQYQEGAGEQLVFVAPEAVRRVLETYTILNRGDFAQALRMVDSADSIQSDRSARIFIGGLAGLRALILGYLGRTADSEREALRGLSLAPRNPESRLVLAATWADRGEYARAEAALETLLVDNPDHPSAGHMLELIRERRARAAAPGAR
jgi:tetratricopeptide (TPR) repeat protein